MLTAFWTKLAAQRGRHLLGHDHARPVLRLLRGRAQVRRHDHVRQAEDRAPSVYGSVGNTSSAAPATCPDSQRGDQGVQVDQVAAGGVHDPHAGLHEREPLGVDQVPGLGGERRVQRDEVGLQQQVLERRRRHLQLAAALGRHERVEHHDPHTERAGAGGDQLADAAEADDAEHLVGQLHAAEALALPAPLDERRVRLGDVARDREQQAERVLGRGHHVRPGGVRDDDAAAGGGGDVDVVDPGAGPADHLQLAGVLEQPGRHARGAADDQRVVGADALGQLLGRRVELDVDLELPAQELDSGRGDLLGDEDARHPDANTSTARATPAPGGRRLVAELAERELEAGQRRHDVELVHVAHVADAHDPSAQRALAAGEHDAVAVAQDAVALLAVDARRA